MASDLASLAADDELLRRVAASSPSMANNPGLAVALARSGATQSQIRAVAGFADAAQLAVKVAQARQSGVKLDFSNDDRALMTASNIVYNDVDKQMIDQESQQAQQKPRTGILGKISNFANNATQLPVIKQGLHFLDRANDIFHGGGRIAASGGLLNAAGVDLGALNHPLVGGNLADANAAEARADMANNGYTPGNLLDTFEFYSRGSQVYHPMDDLRKQYSPDLVNYAQKYLENAEAFTAPNLNDDELAKRQKLLTDPKFEALVKQVDSRHISPGRDLATAVGLKPGDEVTIGNPLARAIPHAIGGALTDELNKKVDAYNVVSGSIDGVYSFFADPTIILGKGVQAARLARYGLGDLNDQSRIEDLMNNNAAVKNGWMQFQDAAKTIRKAAQPNASLEDKAAAAAAYAQVHAQTRELLPLLDEINGGGLRNGQTIDTYEDLVDWVSGKGGLARMRNGLAGREAPLMPGALPRIGYRQAKGLLAKRLTERNVKVLDLENPGEDAIDVSKHADQFIPNQVDGVNANGADMTGLDAKVAASNDAAATGLAAKAWRRTVKGRLSTLVNRMTTLLPEHNNIDLASAAGAEDIKRFAAMFMPRSHANLLAAKFSVASLGERRTIAESVYQQAMHASGITSTTSGRAWLKAQGEVRALLNNSSYDNSGKDLDKINGANGEPERRTALYEGQTSTDFWLPSFTDMRRMSAKVSIYDWTLRSAMESHMMDTALGALRTSWLVSPASALRNGIENVVSAHIRGASADEIARSRAALSSVLAKRVADRASNLAKQEVDSKFRPVKGHLRGVYYGKIRSNMRMAESIIGRHVADDELVKRAQELVDDEMNGDLKHLIALSGLATRGDARDVDEMISALDKGFSVKKIGFKSDGYSLGSADGAGGARYWANQLGIRFSGSEGQHVLKAAVDENGVYQHPVAEIKQWAEDNGFASRKDGSPTAAARKAFAEAHPAKTNKQALIDFMLSDDYKTARAKMERFGTLRDGTAVGDDQPMLERAARELAEDQIEDMKSLITGRNGEISDDLVKKLSSGGTPDVEFLQGLGEDVRPEQVIKPKWVPDLSGGAMVGNVVQALADAGYHYAVARPLAWMSTLPIYHANYVKAYKRVENMLAGQDVGEAHIRDVARMHAMDLTTQMVDNPAVRSQMALITRNVFNFWRAQEDFMRRWGRNLKENPAALRELQLAVEGGMHTGLVHKDDQGNLVFSYPGSGAFIQAMGKALSVFGPLKNGVGLGVVPNMSTKIQFLNAGLDRPFLPTTSPVASIPLRLLNHFTHDQVALLRGITPITEGSVGAGRSWWAQFIPSPVYRFMAGQTPDDQDGMFASAARNAAVNLEAAGLTPHTKYDAQGNPIPGTTPTPDEQDAYKKRIQIGVRNHLTARAMLALILPGAPGAPTEETDASQASKLEAAAFNSVSLKQEFSQWVNQYGYQRALALWTKVHPDDLVYTVSTTQGKGGVGGFLSPTEGVLNWMNQNKDLVDKYPTLAAYFAPDAPGDFSDDAWRTELELGLRQHKDFDTFYRDIVVKNAETGYYASRDARDKAVANAMAAGDTEKAKLIKSGFSDWVDEYKQMNPLLLEKWQAGDQSTTRLTELTDEVSRLSQDKTLMAKLDPHGNLALLADAYKKMQDYRQTHDARSADEKAQQDRLNTAYLEWVSGILKESPQLIPLYQGVFDRVE